MNEGDPLTSEHPTFTGAADSAARADRDELGRIRPGSGSLNPKGRPRKGQSMTDRLNYYADNFTVKQLRAIRIADLTPKDAHAVRQLLDGLKTTAGALRARAYTYNRIDGLPRQTIEVNSDAEERHDAIRDGFLAALLGEGPEDDDADEVIEELPDA